MTKQIKLLIGSALTVLALSAFYSILKDSSVAVLNPKGAIADQQKDLIIIATLLMLVVVLPVFIMTFFIVWKYRASNKKATYTPDVEGNRVAEIIWWVIPSVIIAVLSVITWRSSYELAPYRAIASTVKPVEIQVVALQWKWLFIYPESGIATVNYIQIPEDTPIRFKITADAPMNSFWIPQLGGQIYAMAGMERELNLIASGAGEYKGLSANISGRGFSGMRFAVSSTSASEFQSWVAQVKSSGTKLDFTEYSRLSKPSEDVPQAKYASSQKGIYDNVIMKYMMPGMGGSPESGQNRNAGDNDMKTMRHGEASN